MKLLTDFDGVLTDLADEARRVRALFEEEVGAAAYAAALASALKEPHGHGWRWGGRITAFVNEDPFVEVNGVAALMDAEEGGGSTRRRDLAQRCYMRMTEETAAGKLHPLDPIVPQVLGGLMARGVEIVVVSNSGTERIMKLLRGAGMSPKAHGEGSGPLRVRGDAKKFVLGDAPRTFAAGPYLVDVDRPHYDAIVREERPDVVMGDVFSLDLAVPLRLAETDPAFAGVRLWLRRRSYTPPWPVAHLAQAAPARWSAVDRLEQVPALLFRDPAS